MGRNILSVVFLFIVVNMYGADGDSLNITHLGGISFGKARVLAIEDSLLLMGQELNVSILNIKDRINPVYIGHYTNLWSKYDDYSLMLVNDIIIKDNYMIGGYWAKGVYIVDISDPMRSAIICTLDVSGFKMFLNDNDTLFIATDGDKVYLADLSVMANAVIIDSFYVKNRSEDIYVKDNYAYVADKDSGLTVVDISNGNIVSSLNINGYANEILINGNYVYLFTKTDTTGFAIIDISSPLSPSLVNTCNIDGQCMSAIIENDSLYIVNNNGYLKIFDIADPTNVNEIISYDCGDTLYDIVKSGNYLYIATSDQGIKNLDISDIANIYESGDYNAPWGRVENVNVVGNYAYICGEANGSLCGTTGGTGYFRIVDVSDINHPTFTGELSLSTTKMEIRGHYAYLATGSAVQIVDISDKTTPEIIFGDGTINCYDVSVCSDYMYVAGYDNIGAGVMGIYNISSIDNPQLITLWYGDSNSVFLDRPMRVYVKKNTGYLLDAEYGYMYILDVTNKDSIIVLGSIGFGGALDVEMEIYDDYAYIAMDENFYIVNIADETNPQIVYHNSFSSNVWGIYVSSEDYIYLSLGEEGIYVYYVGDKANPQLKYYYDEFDVSHGNYVIGNYIYSACEYELNTYYLISHDTYVYVPNGGEEWQVGKAYIIKWRPDGYGSYSEVSLYYSTDKVHYNLIDNTYNDGEYEWTVPQDIDADYIWIKVEKVSKALLSDISDYPVYLTTSLYLPQERYKIDLAEDNAITMRVFNIPYRGVKIEFFSRKTEGFSYNIYDITGRKVFTDDVNADYYVKTINIKRGVYFIITQNNGIKYKYKFVIF